MRTFSLEEHLGMLDARCQISAVPSDGALVLWDGRVDGVRAGQAGWA